MCLPLIAVPIGLALGATAETAAATGALALSGLSAATGIAGAAVSYAGQQQNAKAQREYQDAVYKSTKESANSAFSVQQTQERAQTAQAIDANNLQAAQARSTASVASAQAGAAGQSYDALLADFDRQQAMNNQTLLANADTRTLSYYAQRNDRIAGATPRPVESPSALALGLQIGQTAFQSAADYDYYKPGPRPDLGFRFKAH
jgi:hypothetical protein